MLPCVSLFFCAVSKAPLTSFYVGRGSITHARSSPSPHFLPRVTRSCVMAVNSNTDCTLRCSESNPSASSSPRKEMTRTPTHDGLMIFDIDFKFVVYPILRGRHRHFLRSTPHPVCSSSTPFPDRFPDQWDSSLFWGARDSCLAHPRSILIQSTHAHLMTYSIEAFV